ncbi:MAG: hypothetical protein HC830_02365 [Bacteroidetes bacterium]|nr:hypothetical protein [Bacteroidota bacterium]
MNESFIRICGFSVKEYSREKLKQFIETEMPGVFKFATENDLQNLASHSIEFITPTREKKYLELTGKNFELSGEKVVLVITHDVTERKMMDQKIVEAIFRTQEETQGRYAQELHDGLGPVLSTVKMYIEWLCSDKNSVNKELIKNNSLHAIDEAINQAKEIANNLSPHVLQRFGLVNALKNHADRIRETHNINIGIQAKITDRLASDVEVMFYRILLECVNNSVKHAKPENISIQLEKQNQKLLVTYTDNGKGFDVDKTLSETRGMGIFNMQNRIKLIGGEMNIRSVQGRGTRIDIILNN